ncbi:MAG TPA: hypothetical protein VH208_06020 [Myxococcaceae bacterium]|nr:hypothetical protein [Myxococcaceae bacterium]
MAIGPGPERLPARRVFCPPLPLTGILLIDPLKPLVSPELDQYTLFESTATPVGWLS